jgi:hypothetical protein
MALSTYAGNKLLDHLHGRTSYTMPTCFFALYTADPGIGGTAVTNEAAYSGYARVAALSGGSSLFGAAAGKTSQNNTAVVFPALVSGTVTATHIGLVDSSSGAGNLLEFGPLAAASTYVTGQSPTAAIGALNDTVV